MDIISATAKLGVAVFGVIFIAGVVSVSNEMSKNGSSFGFKPASEANTMKVTCDLYSQRMVIWNKGNVDIHGVTVYLNGTPEMGAYKYQTGTTIRPGGSVSVTYSQAVKRNGERFNPYTHVVTTFWVGGGNDGYDYAQYGR